MTLLDRRLFTLGAAGFAAAACSPQQSAEQEANYVNVYSARHYQADKTLYAAFTQKSGIEVRVLPANGEQLLERLRVEGDATEADLIVAADAGNLWRVKDAGLLQAVTTPALEAGVPARLHDPEGYWWAFSRRARVIVYNKAALKPEDVATMDALASPALKGAVCARSSTNVYMLSTLASRIERLGADNARAWAQGVRNNFARDPQGSDSDQIRAVAEGACKATIVNHYYLVRLMTSEDPADRAIADKVGLVFPDQAGAGTHMNISGAGVSAYAKRKDRAIELLEFLVSDEAQRLLAPVNVEFPIRDTIAPSPALVALGTFKQEDIPLDALGRHQAEAASIFEQVGWR